MTPIRKGDGTPVEPKGVSQIRTGDGRILFDGPAIPDSAIYQQPWDEGESTTVADVIGDRNGSLDNPDWVSDADFEGGWKLNFDNDTV